ncbi:MAG: trimethylamine methyltransferase family protein, partial [Desulfobacterales bacterium]|nr:trimethylamine methyltransferase family protein [Desulfobacterales bacterium]
PVNEDTLAVDIIGRVGSQGQFITEKHTFENMKKMSQPALIDRRVRDRWEQAGGQTMHEKAMDTARDILANHKPTPLSDEVKSQMRSIVENCEAEIAEEKEREGK